MVYRGFRPNRTIIILLAAQSKDTPRAKRRIRHASMYDGLEPTTKTATQIVMKAN